MATQLALRVRGLARTYPNGIQALNGVSLDVEEGDFFALLGPNGAGKSTLIGIVCSLVDKSGGTVEVFGHGLDRDPRAVKACIGVVPQEVNFNPWETPLQIVVNQAGFYGVERRRALSRAERYLNALDLWGVRNLTSRTLSGGMKRRLLIARALMNEPRLLILDEPTAGVDIEIRRAMWRFLREVNDSGTTIILTTHYLEEAEQLCRSIAIIDKGRIVEDTKLKDLLGKLHLQTFIIDVKSPLASAPEVDGYAMRRVDDVTYEVDVYRDQGMNRLFDELSRRAIAVVSLRNKTNRLEELFVRLVGAGEGAATGNGAGGAPESTTIGELAS